MTYEWLTKGVRRVRFGSVTISRTVYPPRKGDTYPWIRDIDGKRRAAIPAADGAYDIGEGRP